MNILMLVIAACLIALPVSATPITYEFTGTITSASGTHLDIRLPGVTIGQAFTGTATLDAESLDRLMVVIGPHTLGHSIDSMSVFSDGAGDHLNMTIGTWLIQSSLEGFFRGEVMSLMMLDPTGTAVTSTSLDQDFSAFETGELSFLGYSLIDDGREDYDSFISLSGNVNTFTRVPEPSTLVLLGIGVLGASLGRRRLSARTAVRSSS
jgi:hypothetical protein